MLTYSTVDFRKSLSDLLNRVFYKQERISITKRGKTIAVIVPVEDIEYLQYLEDQEDIRDAKKALAEAKREGTIPFEDLKKELGL